MPFENSKFENQWDEDISIEPILCFDTEEYGDWISTINMVKERFNLYFWGEKSYLLEKTTNKMELAYQKGYDEGYVKEHYERLYTQIKIKEITYAVLLNYWLIVDFGCDEARQYVFSKFKESRMG